MGLFLKQNIGSHTQIGIWELTESSPALLAQLAEIKHKSFDKIKEQLNGFKYEQRKKEWLAIRLLLSHLLNTNEEISYDAQGKPFLKNSDKTISISHAKAYAAIILSNKPQTGIDIERMNRPIEHIAAKFVSDTELQQIAIANRIFQLYLYWSAKETLYKIYGKKKLSFIENLRIQPLRNRDEKRFTGEIVNHNFYQKYTLHYLTFNNYLVVWCCE